MIRRKKKNKQHLNPFLYIILFNFNRQYTISQSKIVNSCEKNVNSIWAEDWFLLPHFVHTNCYQVSCTTSHDFLWNDWKIHSLNPLRPFNIYLIDFCTKMMRTCHCFVCCNEVHTSTRLRNLFEFIFHRRNNG